MATSTDALAAIGDGGDAIRVLAGDCTVRYDGDHREEHRGLVTVVVKPDNTVLVHDADGYQPVAWLTRADAVTCSRSGAHRSGSAGSGARRSGSDRGGDPAASGETITGTGGGGGTTASSETPAGSGTATDGAAFTVDASDGDERLRVTAHTEDGYATYPATRAGHPVGQCPNCDGTLVRSGRGVTCIGCGDSYGLPDGATVREERCECGLPRLRVERGEPLDVCLDPRCEPLSEAVKERYDRAWDCPECGADLRVIDRNTLLVGCGDYPDCDVNYGFPTGTVVDTCDCGLPVFEMASGRRCLDTGCEHW